MLNKKAIAAFAAGATLLSGFAFAAPAMAACPANPQVMSVAKAATKAAYDEYAAAKAVLDKMTVSEDATGNVPTITPAAGKTVNSYYKVNADTSIQLFDKAIKQDIKSGEADALRAFAAKRNAYVASKTAKDTQQAKVNELSVKYLAAKDAESCATPDPDKKQEAIDNVRDAAKTLQNADNDFAKAKKAFYAAKDAYRKAQAELNARYAAYQAAQAAYDAFETSGVNDSAKEQRLADAVNRAEAHWERANTAYGEAETKYNDTKAAALAAKAVYEAALQAYKDVYNAAVAAGVNPSLLPPVTTADPLDLSFNPVPGAKELYAAAVSGKFGKEVQAAAQKGKDAKASAQQNNKNNAASADAKGGASASAAAQLPKSGAAVAMAAVAASVLAGMGAALRKIRH